MAEPGKTRRRFAPSLTAGLIMGGVLILIAIVAPIVLGTEAEALGGGSRQGPSAEHLLGTDALGRDVLARSLVATRLTLLMAAGATALSVTVGVLIGGLIWLAPRLLREFVLRIIDASVAFPALVLALVVAAILGPGSLSAVIAIGVAGSRASPASPRTWSRGSRNATSSPPRDCSACPASSCSRGTCCRTSRGRCSS
jgi:ABC-type dipeptide/oligopeptide/nickel transport system permease subunit